MVEFSTFFVLGTYKNGRKAKGTVLVKDADDHIHLADDGWYFLVDEETVPGPKGGPYHVQEDVIAAAKAYIKSLPVTWAFPLNGGAPYEWKEDGDGDGSNLVEIQLIRDGVYRCTLVGSYETLTLDISCGSNGAAADVYRQVLIASNEYQ